MNVVANYDRKEATIVRLFDFPTSCKAVEGTPATSSRACGSRKTAAYRVLYRWLYTRVDSPPSIRRSSSYELNYNNYNNNKKKKRKIYKRQIRLVTRVTIFLTIF